MKKLQSILIMLIVSILLATSVPLGGGTVVAEAVELDDPEVPQNNREEVAWWIDRTGLVLFNNTVPTSNNEPGEASIFWNESTKAIGPGEPQVYTSQEAAGCKLTVNFSAANDKPARGTLSDACTNTVKSVRLEKKNRAIIDGYFTSTATANRPVAIYMPRYLRTLDNCSGDFDEVKPDEDSYDREGQFLIEDGRHGATWKAQDTGGRTQVGLKDVGNLADEVFGAQQIAYCPDGDHGVGGYGDTGDLSSDKFGRRIYIRKGTTQDRIKESAADAAVMYHTKKAKQAEFIAFFSIPANQAKLSECSDRLTSNLTGATLRQYAVDTLIKPIPGPFSDCIREKFADDPEFARIDSIVAPDAVGSPAAVGADEECSGGPPIIGEIFCSIVEAVFDGIYAVFSSVIEYFADPPNLVTDQGSKMESIWASLRNVANVLFILSFLLVIFQYMTSYNVADAYFIKKFVPRLVLAVILTQASGWIVAELAYFFHDLGQSVQSIVFWSGGGGFSAGSAVGVAGGSAMVAIFLSTGGFPFIAIALVLGLILFLILIITVIVLAIRHILIILLAIFAPLAFAALALPQLEGTFKKWLKMYVQLLAMYPIIMLMIAAASLIGSTLSGGGILEQILGFIVQFLPFFILPFTFKFTGGIMAGVSAKVLSAPKKGYSAYKKGEGLYESKTDRGRARAAKKKTLEQNKQDRASRTGAAAATAAMERARNDRRGVRGAIARRRAFGTFDQSDPSLERLTSLRSEQQRRQELEDSKLRLEQSQHDVTTSSIRGNRGTVMAAGTAKDTDAIYEAVARGETLTITGSDGVERTLGGNAADQEMAMNQLASFGRDKVIRRLQDPASGLATDQQAALQRSINSNASSLVGKAPDIVKGAQAAFDGGISAEAISGFSDGTVKEAFNHVFRPGASAQEQQALINEAHKTVASDKLLDGTAKGTAQALYDELSSRGLLSATAKSALERKIGI